MYNTLKVLKSFWKGDCWAGVTHSDAAVINLAFEVLHQADQMLTDASRDVLAERRRQIEEEEWSLERDDQYPAGELSQAAACYAYLPLAYAYHKWPWAAHLWKPSNPRCNLVKAGALILAEIERIDRQAVREGK